MAITSIISEIPKNAPRSDVSGDQDVGKGSQRTPLILIADDNPLDVKLIKRALARANIVADIHVVEDGEQAILLFDKIQSDATCSCPDLILLDINMPLIDGLQVLAHMRGGGRCCKSEIVMVTGSDMPDERKVMERWHAGYFQKPPDLNEYMKLGQVAKTMLARH